MGQILLQIPHSVRDQESYEMPVNWHTERNKHRLPYDLRLDENHCREIPTKKGKV